MKESKFNKFTRIMAFMLAMIIMLSGLPINAFADSDDKQYNTNIVMEEKSDIDIKSNEFDLISKDNTSNRVTFDSNIDNEDVEKKYCI